MSEGISTAQYKGERGVPSLKPAALRDSSKQQGHGV